MHDHHVTCFPYRADYDEQSQSGSERSVFSEVLDQNFPQNSAESPTPAHPLFPNTIPAPIPSQASAGTRSSYEERWTIPEQYQAHWERVPDNIKLTPVCTKGYEAACMTPTQEHEGKMYSESKCFSLLPRSSLEHLAGPHDGPTYCFVAECLSEMPDMSLKVLYFFDNVRIILQSQDRSPFVFPTDKIGLSVSMSRPFRATPRKH